MQGSLQILQNYLSFSVKMAPTAVPQDQYYSRVVLFSYCFLVFLVVDFISKFSTVNGEISRSTMMEINSINKEGPYLGIIVPNAFEMNPLLDSSSFLSHPLFPFLDFSGKRFRIGRLGPEKIIIVLTGMGMLNAGITTQLLLSLFKVKGVLHYGVAGNANPELQIGDVTIPRFWAHTGVWNWQRYGDGPDDKLAFESDGGGITRKIGYLNVSDYTNQTLENNSSSDNLLNNIWYQPEEVFPVNGTPEINQNAFWVPVNNRFYELAKSLKNVKLERCVNTTCLPRTPKVVRVQNGISASIVLDNKAYREFLQSKFNATPVDMETAAVALVCHQQDVPFIALRSLSDLAGGGSAESNESATFSSLAAKNAVTALLRFIPLLSSKMLKFQESAPNLL